jgi:DNA-binding CsgD family transcriptional regulator
VAYSSSHAILLKPQPRKPFSLSSREAQVLRWLSQGKTNKEIGVILEVSPRTVQKHLEHIYQKMGVESRTAAAAKAYEIMSPASK